MLLIPLTRLSIIALLLQALRARTLGRIRCCCSAVGLSENGEFLETLSLFARLATEFDWSCCPNFSDLLCCYSFESSPSRSSERVLVSRFQRRTVAKLVSQSTCLCRSRIHVHPKRWAGLPMPSLCTFTAHGTALVREVGEQSATYLSESSLRSVYC